MEGGGHFWLLRCFHSRLLRRFYFCFLLSAFCFDVISPRKQKAESRKQKWKAAVISGFCAGFIRVPCVASISAFCFLLSALMSFLPESRRQKAESRNGRRRSFLASALVSFASPASLLFLLSAFCFLL